MEKNETYKPKKVGSKYYWIGSGHILNGVYKAIWENSDIDISRHKNSNCFRSRSEAEFVRKSFHGKF